MSTRAGWSVAILAALLVLGAGSLAGGCRKQAEEDRAAVMPPPVGQNEIERGIAACKDYIAKACACAEARPEDAEVREVCDLSGAKLSSLEMVSQVNREPKDAVERAATERTIRRIVSSCVEGMTDLATRGCPR